MSISRRAFALSALALPALAACGSSGSDEKKNGGADSGSGASDGGGEKGAAAYPVTIEHIYGKTEIPAEPKRIATVSWVNADSVLALGIVPVGMPDIEWGGNANKSTDWIDAKLKELGAEKGSDKAPTTYSEANGVAFDQIAALTPDLIIGAYSGLTKDDYDKLSRIAPTIGPLAPNYTTAWPDTMAAVGKATGREDEAKKIVDEVTAALAEVGEKNPEVKESTFIAGNLDPAKNTIAVYTAGDTRPRFFTALGMTQADVVTKNTKDKNTFLLEWSSERADELEGDIFYTWAAKGTTIPDIQANPLFNQVPAIKKGAVVLTADDHLTLSISAASALSLPWAIENVVPSVVDAVRVAKKG